MYKFIIDLNFIIQVISYRQPFNSDFILKLGFSFHFISGFRVR